MLRARVISIMIATTLFLSLQTDWGMSLGSNYTIMKNFNKRLIKFKNVKPIESVARLKKEQIIKNAYKDEYDNGGELNGVENKKVDYK